LLFTLLAIGGAALCLAAWLFSLNSNSERDTYGLDTAAPAAASRLAAARPAPPSFLELTSPENPTGQGTARPGGGNSVIGPARAENAARAAVAAKAQGGRREEAARALKEAAIKYQKLVEAFILRMQAKHPSLARYGEDWAASPELCAVRDQYWADRDPLKFVHSLAKSDDFSRLLGRYASDPGVHDVVMQGLKEAPPDLTAAANEVLYTDKTANAFVAKVTGGAGLPANLSDALNGGVSAPPDTDKIISDIVNSKAVAPR
jgi:hypothetical protein